MSMMSFRDALSKAASHHTTPTAPAAAPSFLEEMAEAAGAVVAAQPAPAPVQAPVNVTSALPARTTQTAAPKAAGFGAMLQRVAESRGVAVVAVHDQTATAPTVQPHVEAPAATNQIDENILKSALGPILNTISGTPDAGGTDPVTQHHHKAYDHLEAAGNAIAAAHSAIRDAHAATTDPVHKQHLEQQSLHLSSLYGSITSAKASNNFGIQHHLGQAPRQ